MLDIILVIIFIFVFAISTFIGVKVVSEFNTTFSGQFAEEQESKDILDKGMATLHMFDAIFMMFAIGIAAAVIIGALNVQSHPAFFIFSIVMNAIIILLSSIFTNVFDKFATSSDFASITNSFPMIVTFIRHLPIFVFVVGLIIAVVMYTRPQNPWRNGEA
jgi:hypothetical protein